MKLLYRLVFIIGLTSCKIKDIRDSNLEMATYSIVGLVPSDQLNFTKISDNNATIDFSAPYPDVLSWLYKWQVISDDFQNISFEEFEKNAKHAIDVNGQLFLGKNEYKLRQDNGQLFYVECITSKSNNNEYKCVITILKL